MGPSVFVFPALLLLGPIPAAASSFISDLDRAARRCFDPADIIPGFVSLAPPCDAQMAPSDAVLQARDLAGPFTESSRAQVPSLGATAWSYSEADLSNHPTGFLLSIATLELHYIHAKSTGLLPVSMRIYRRGDPFYETPGTEGIAAARQSKESFLRILLQRQPLGRAGPLLPANELAGRSVLGTTDYGNVVSDCRTNRFAVENDVSGRAFARAQRRNCLVNVSPWEDDARCSFNTNACLAETVCETVPDEPTDQCCTKCCDDKDGRSPWSHYNPNATCAWVSLGTETLSDQVTLQGLLDSRTYFADPDEGTGLDLQSVILNIRTREDRNGPGAEEATRQAGAYTEASASLINQMAADLEEAVWSRPTPIDLTLVIAAQLAGAMAVDAGKLLRFFLLYGKRGLPKEDISSLGYRSSLFGLASFVAFLSTVPGLLTAIVIIYLELQHSNLGWTNTSTGWFFTDLYPETGGEIVWHVRRVIADTVGTTEHSVRPIYILLPVAMTIFEFAVEVVLALGVVRKIFARLKEQQKRAVVGRP